jgi:signal transduction histidine kinase
LTELEQSRVFEKFYRGRHEGSAIQGTGMGLAIAKEIAEAHGGAVSVESQVGQGTRFTITLKAAVMLKEEREQPA